MSTISEPGVKQAAAKKAGGAARNLPLALMLLVFGVYLVTMSGHTYSPDEETMLTASQSLIVNGSWAIPPSRALVEVTGADGKRYSQYGPGQSLAAVPWVLVGRAVGDLFPKDQSGIPLRLILASYNALIAAGICGLVAAAGMALGYSAGASLFTAVVLAFCTFLWPHSRTFFSEPLVALCLFASFYLLLVRPSWARGWWWLAPVVSGLLFAGAVATKVQYAVVLPAFLVYLGWAAVQAGRKEAPRPPAPSPRLGEGENREEPLGDTPKPPGGEHPATPFPQSAITNPQSQTPPQGLAPLHPTRGEGSSILLRPVAPSSSLLASRYSLLAWLLGLGLGLVPLFLYNLAVFGGAFTTGYGADLKGTFKTPVLEGMQGLLLSSGKGLFWYALPVLLALWGLAKFARKHRAEIAFIGLLFLSVVVFFSMYIFWPGDGSWGPRYLIPVLPFLMLPAIPAVQGAFESRWARPRAFNPALLAVSVIVALGFVVNLLGVLVNFDTYINVVSDDATRYWRLDASPIFGHANLLGQRLDEWITRLHPPGDTVQFKSGFSYSEGDKATGELLPRWTTGSGVLDISRGGGEPVQVTLRLADHRPPSLPRANVRILVGGTPAQVSATPVAGHPESTDYAFALGQDSGRVTIESDTWNPSKLQEGGRNEDLGLMLEQVSISQGGGPRSYKLIEALPAPPYYPQPRWYYDPGTHHPSDLWETYLLETGMGRKAALGLGLPVLLIALASGLSGWWKLRSRHQRPVMDRQAARDASTS